MSYVTVLLLTCDGPECVAEIACPAPFGASPAALRRARQAATAEGWSYVAHVADHAGRDLCPRCTKRHLDETGGVI